MSVQKIILGFEPDQKNILPMAKAVQKAFGFVSLETVDQIARYVGLTSAAVFSAVSFYDEISFESPGRLEIKICDSANCSAKGAESVISQIESFFRQRAGDDFNPLVRISRVSCLGMCLSGPVMIVNGTVYEKVTPAMVDEILKAHGAF